MSAGVTFALDFVSEGRLSDCANIVFWGKFLKKLGRFLFWVIFYFFWALGDTNPVLDA